MLPAPMAYAYYDRLTGPQKAIYRQSDRVTHVTLDRPDAVKPLVVELAEALARDDRVAVEDAANELATAITLDLGIVPVSVSVLAVRPQRAHDELHGLYTWEAGKRARIQVWMRTAKQKRVVAFRTFLRTLLHELCHHIDYAHLRLGESFHTQGFFRRESSLVRQLLPPE
jgi:hypothetical protein